MNGDSTPSKVLEICSRNCGAKCCRGPRNILLNSGEVGRLEGIAAARGLPLEVRETYTGEGYYIPAIANGGDRFAALDLAMLAVKPGGLIAIDDIPPNYEFARKYGQPSQIAYYAAGHGIALIRKEASHAPSAAR